jgi:hypothetical protein
MPSTAPYNQFSPANTHTGTTTNLLPTGEQTTTAVNQKTPATGSAIGTKSNTFSFEDILNNLMPTGQQEKINEEQLFSVLIEERLTTLKGAEAASAFHQRFETYKTELSRNDGYIPEEDAARAALKDLVKEGVLSTEDAEKIHAQAFQAAQIDNNTAALYDSFGSTMAVTMVKLALQSSSEKMSLFDSGKLDAGRLSLDFSQETAAPQVDGTTDFTPSNPNGDFVGGGGFLFKPVSEGNGKLVILLPSSMSGEISNVNIVDSNGKLLESGDKSGNFDDGRPVFRFDRPGGKYPDNIVVAITMNDGRHKEYNIPNPKQRYE